MYENQSKNISITLSTLLTQIRYPIKKATI